MLAGPVLVGSGQPDGDDGLNSHVPTGVKLWSATRGLLEKPPRRPMANQLLNKIPKC